jgi:hypothetical protein
LSAVIDRRYRRRYALNGDYRFSSVPNCRAVILAAGFEKIGGEDRRPTILEERKMRARGDSNLKPSDP